MEEEGVYLKKVDRRAYRKLKAMAAERGEPVYKLLNEAIALYLVTPNTRQAEQENALISLEAADNVAFRKAEADPSLRGRWVGVAEGALVAIGDNEEAVLKRMRDVYSKKAFAHAIVGEVGAKVRGEEREWLAGSLQQA